MKGINMNSSNRLIMTALAWVLFCACFGCATPEKPAPAKDESRELSTQALASQKQIPAAHPLGAGFIPSISSYYPTPTKMDLCGEAVPLNNQDVFERFDKEFTIVVYNHAQVYLWLKRMERYFPWIEERLHRYGLPDDLKYVVVAESDLV
ncbi:MAG: lytic transglycosylase domain-containing protein, partial [Deltaproteobacteria bacterium]|nr:lytic transglycosylase domain-containing protein [Deltaproteobacteria bacterium]